MTKTLKKYLKSTLDTLVQVSALKERAVSEKDKKDAEELIKDLSTKIIKVVERELYYEKISK